MFNIIFYVNKSKNNVVNKNIVNPITLVGTLKNQSSIFNPTIIIKNNENILTQNYNYIFIEKFNRFYYITDITVLLPNIEITTKCDVLESFKADFLNSQQIIGRQETQFNLYLEDDKIQAQKNKFLTIKKVGITPFSTEALNPEGTPIWSDINYHNFVVIASNLE